MRAGLQLKGAPLLWREGVLLRVTDDSTVLYGDAAPLPGFSRDTVDDVMTELARHDASSLSRANFACASLSWAVSHMVPQEFLDDMRIKSALLISGEAEVAQALLDYAANEEAVVIKLKVDGRAPAQELVAVGRLVWHFGSALQLRLDGNRQLSIEHTTRLWDVAGETLAWFEEPVPLSEVGGLDVKLPLAVDECLYESGDGPMPAEAVMMQQRARAWIVKPTLLGPERTDALIAAARKDNVLCVISSAFESAVGRASLRLLAATTCQNVAHGLGTAPFFAEDFTSSSLAALQWKQIA